MVHKFVFHPKNRRHKNNVLHKQILGHTPLKCIGPCVRSSPSPWSLSPHLPLPHLLMMCCPSPSPPPSSSSLSLSCALFDCCVCFFCLHCRRGPSSAVVVIRCLLPPPSSSSPSRLQFDCCIFRRHPHCCCRCRPSSVVRGSVHRPSTIIRRPSSAVRRRQQ